MIHRKKHCLFGLLTLVCMVASACAVLTIDVDVYKGPLVNDEDVQEQQIVALAIGAKPLLVNLRDQLEWRHPKLRSAIVQSKGDKYCQGMIVEVCEEVSQYRWYQADYIPPENKKDGSERRFVSRFQDEQAKQVNAILSLYKDWSPEPEDQITSSQQPLPGKAFQSTSENGKTESAAEAAKNPPAPSPIPTPSSAENVKQSDDKNGRRSVQTEPSTADPSEITTSVEPLSCRKAHAQNHDRADHRGVVGALKHGRPPCGLESLTEEYLSKEAAWLQNQKDQAKEQAYVLAREELYDSLTQFAQKVLYLANNTSLIDPPRDRGLLPWMRDIFAVAFIGEGEDDTAKLAKANFERVLQAVGNSILVQIDEVRQRYKHLKRMTTLNPFELSAAKPNLPQTPDATIARIVTDLSLEKAKANQQQAPLLQHTIDAIGGSKATVVNQANQFGVPIGSDVVYELLKRDIGTRLIQAQRASPRIQADVDMLTNASDILKNRNPPSQNHLQDVLNTIQEKTELERKDVLEGLIASLQHIKIETLRDEGADSPRIAGIDAAIKAATDYRSGLIYIRPPSAYLRTSFPATSLQSDPRLVWENMLEEQAIRGLPFAQKSVDFFNSDGKRDAAVTADIDKQFWQNINRVKVSGAGITNYAIAKDDIGNWYVKRYDSNPKPIIESAQALAMYNLSGSMNTNLLRQLKAKDAPGQSAGTKSDVPQSNLGRVLDRYRSSYEKQTNEDKDALVAALSKSTLKERILANWNASDDISNDGTNAASLKSKLETVASIELQPVQEGLQKNADKIEAGGQIITALHGIKRFNTVLVSELRTLTKQPRQKLKAAEDLRNQKSKDLDDAKQRRADAEDRRNRATDQTRAQAEADLTQANTIVQQKEGELATTQKDVSTAQEQFARIDKVVNAGIAQATRVVRTFLQDILQRRDQVSKEYESAVLFIADAK